MSEINYCNSDGFSDSGASSASSTTTLTTAITTATIQPPAANNSEDLLSLLEKEVKRTKVLIQRETETRKTLLKVSFFAFFLIPLQVSTALKIEQRRSELQSANLLAELAEKENEIQVLQMREQNYKRTSLYDLFLLLMPLDFPSLCLCFSHSVCVILVSLRAAGRKQRTNSQALADPSRR